MAVSNEAQYIIARDAPYQRLDFQKIAQTTVLGRRFSSWVQGTLPAIGTVPTTSVVPTSATTGAFGQKDSSGTQRILRFIVEGTFAGSGMITICDKLVHSGGLSAITTGAQTTNLPTAALTRKTTGKGVQASLDIYTAVGSTGTTATISYTNTVPTAGQTSPTVTFGGTGFGTVAGACILMPLAVGDVGVTAVASVTLAASTLTAGNFGVTLFYPLVSIPIDNIPIFDTDYEALYDFGTWFPVVDSSACLYFQYVTTGATTGVVSGQMLIGEDA